MDTGDVQSGLPAGPTGCGGAVLALVLVALLMIGFVAAVWWALRDIGAA